MAAAKNWFGRVFELVGRPIIAVDEKKKNVIYINPAAEELLGSSAKELTGKSWSRLFDEPSVRRIDALFEILETNRGRGGRKELQLTMKRRTGRPVQVNLTLSVLHDEQTVWLFDLEDLTPILNLQHEKDVLRTEMGRVSKLADIGRLTGGIAHELNNPLAILQGLAENLSDLVERDELEKEKVLAELEPMQETIQRMTRIIHSMMSVARGEEPQMEVLSLAELWERASTGFEALPQLNEVSIESKIDPQLEVTVDSIRIEQIFVNLVKNALFALQSVPRQKRKIRVCTGSHRDQIQIHVENNGPNIPERVSENLYTPFFTTKPVGDGFGLGLFLSYNVMKAHGGTLSHQNLKPQGVRFTLSFPKNRATSLTKARKRVVIADDEAFFRQMLARKLELYGIKVTMARDGVEALQAIHRDPSFDMMITDHRMPGLDGAHLVEDVRKFSEIPILLLTGYGDDPKLVQLHQKGIIQGIIQKPLSEQVLLECLEKYLQIKLEQKKRRAG